MGHKHKYDRNLEILKSNVHKSKNIREIEDEHKLSRTTVSQVVARFREKFLEGTYQAELSKVRNYKKRDPKFEINCNKKPGTGIVAGRDKFVPDMTSDIPIADQYKEWRESKQNENASKQNPHPHTKFIKTVEENQDQESYRENNN